jgi:predicted PurR-regulated permease PerM
VRTEKNREISLPDAPTAHETGRNVSLGFLLVLTALSGYLCWLMAQPFLPALTWAVAIAVVAHPVHAVLEKHIRQRDLAALFAVIFVTAVLVIPGIFLVERAVAEAADGIRQLQAYFGSERWKTFISDQSRVGRAVAWLDANLDVGDSLRSAAGAISMRAPKVVAASFQSLVLLLIMLFTLFYFFRDHRRIVANLIRLLPLPDREIKMLLAVTADAIHATIYGRFTVAAVQGSLGGLMFWILGIHAPLLWAVLMMLFSLVPMLGAFVIWVPAAIVLAIQGSWGKALILTLWGALVIGLVDNFLYPVIVGDRLRMHALLVFFAALGGIAAFGTSGIVIGPVILSIAAGILRLWQQRISGSAPPDVTGVA